MKIFICVAATFLILAILSFSGIIYGTPNLYVHIFYVSGKAEYLRSGENDWERLKAGMNLLSGDSIKTRSGSEVEIGFGGKKENIIHIEPNTHVVIKLKGSEKIELIDGEVFSLVKKLSSGSAFEIRTPTAICGARGTGWGTNANKERTVVSAYENKSYARGFKKDGSLMEEEVVIQEGYQTIVKLFEKPSKLMKISEKDMDKWTTWKQNFSDKVSVREATKERLVQDMRKIQEKQEEIERKRDEDIIDKRDESTTSSSSGSGGQIEEY